MDPMILHSFVKFEIDNNSLIFGKLMVKKIATLNNVKISNSDLATPDHVE